MTPSWPGRLGISRCCRAPSADSNAGLFLFNQRLSSGLKFDIYHVSAKGDNLLVVGRKASIRAASPTCQSEAMSKIELIEGLITGSSHYRKNFGDDLLDCSLGNSWEAPCIHSFGELRMKFSNLSSHWFGVEMAMMFGPCGWLDLYNWYLGYMHHVDWQKRDSLQPKTPGRRFARMVHKYVCLNSSALNCLLYNFEAPMMCKNSLFWEPFGQSRGAAGLMSYK